MIMNFELVSFLSDFVLQHMDQMKNGYQEPIEPRKLRLGHIFGPMILLICGLIITIFCFLLVDVGRYYKERQQQKRRQLKKNLPKLAG